MLTEIALIFHPSPPSPPPSVEVDSKDRHRTEQTVLWRQKEKQGLWLWVFFIYSTKGTYIHVNIFRIVVGVGIPQTSWRHPRKKKRNCWEEEHPQPRQCQPAFMLAKRAGEILFKETMSWRSATTLEIKTKCVRFILHQILVKYFFNWIGNKRFK